MLVTDLDVALEVGARLDVLTVPWVIVGSVASSLLGEPRATADVDLVADLRGEHVRAFCTALGDDYYVDVDTALWATSTRRSFNVIHQVSATKVDVFCCKNDPLSRAQLERRFFEKIGERTAPFLSAEDVVLQKLRWWQELGGSEQQWRDALGVLRVRAETIDREYLERQARANGLSELLDRLMAARDVL